MTRQDESFNFEKAFGRLEAILEKMNSGNVALDDSLKLYEEADALITRCAQKLTSVEERIECLIKKRNGEVELDTDGQPAKESFDVQEAIS